MRYRLALFAAVLSSVLVSEYWLSEEPWESFNLLTFWKKFFLTAILAGGSTWL